MEVPSKVFVSGNRNCYYGFCVAPPKLGVPSPKYENVLKHLMSGDENLWFILQRWKFFYFLLYKATKRLKAEF